MLNISKKDSFKRSKNIFLLATFFLILVTMITYIINPALKEGSEDIKNNVFNSIPQTINMSKVWFYFVHNGFKVIIQMFLLSLIPIQFLYIVNIIVTVLPLGRIFGIILQENFTKGLLLIFATIPHYFFEVFAFCLFASYLFKLNQSIRMEIKRLFIREKGRSIVIESIFEIMKVYIFLILPLTLIAAFFETYIATAVLNLLNK